MSNGNDVAIIGMHCRLDCVSSVEDFWDIFKTEREVILTLDEAMLDVCRDHGNPSVDHPGFIPRYGTIKNFSLFDNDYFRLSSASVGVIDPQHRILLELVVELLSVVRLSGRVGLFASVDPSRYLVDYLLKNKGVLEKFGVENLLEINSSSLAVARIAYLLDFTGSSVAVESSCSSSLTAVHCAAQSILSGENDAVVVGGVRLMLPVNYGYVYKKGGIFSENGHCSAFSSDSSGVVPSSGAGVVVLKRLSDALRDGDPVYAVIKSSSINNDGKERMSFEAPGLRGQIQNINSALNLAGLECVDYIEAHGTGTKIGDQIELAAIKKALEYNEENSKTYIASSKPNIGHTGAASGILGLIKAVLCLNKKWLPKSINCSYPDKFFENKHFELAGSQPWQANGDRLRTAMVSSLGMGGNNAHVILSEYVNSPSQLPEVNALFNKSEFFIYPDVASVLKKHNSDEIDLVEVVKAVWSEYLGVKKIELDSDFFDLGGDSFTAVMMIDHLSQLLKSELDPSLLVMYSSFSDFLRMIKSEHEEGRSCVVTLKSSQNANKTMFLFHPVGGTVYCYRELSSGLDDTWDVYAFEDPRLNHPEISFASIEDMAQMYFDEIIKIQPEGFYYLGGASFGGYTACSVAKKILQYNSTNQVKMLFMMDSPGPAHLPRLLEGDLMIARYLCSLISDDLSEDQVASMGMLECTEYLSKNAQILTGKYSIDDIFSLIKSNISLMSEFVPSDLYVNDFIYFKAKVIKKEFQLGQESSWFDFIQSKYNNIVDIDGDHYSMLLDQSAKVIAQCLNGSS